MDLEMIKQMHAITGRVGNHELSWLIAEVERLNDKGWCLGCNEKGGECHCAELGGNAEWVSTLDYIQYLKAEVERLKAEHQVTAKQLVDSRAVEGCTQIKNDELRRHEPMISSRCWRK